MIKMTGEIRIRWSYSHTAPGQEDLAYLGRAVHTLLLGKHLPIAYEAEEDELVVFCDPQFIDTLNQCHSLDVQAFVERLAAWLEEDRNWKAVGWFTTYDEDGYITKVEIDNGWEVYVASPNWLLASPAKEMLKLEEGYYEALKKND